MEFFQNIDKNILRIKIKLLYYLSTKNFSVTMTIKKNLTKISSNAPVTRHVNLLLL
jgi:hypothetical protein